MTDLADAVIAAARRLVAAQDLLETTCGGGRVRLDLYWDRIIKQQDEFRSLVDLCKQYGEPEMSKPIARGDVVYLKKIGTIAYLVSEEAHPVRISENGPLEDMLTLRYEHNGEPKMLLVRPDEVERKGTP